MVILVDSPASKGLLTIDLIKVIPESRVEILDIQRFMGGAPLLKESIFRKELHAFPFEDFSNALIGFSNTHGHILPQWASILLAFKFEQYNYQELTKKINDIHSSKDLKEIGKENKNYILSVTDRKKLLEKFQHIVNE